MTPVAPRRPSQDEIRRAYGKTLPDVVATDLAVLFCGINPGLYTAAVGHHFARPGNRFWPALQAARFTERLLRPHEERLLLPLGYGITNVVARATAAADELSTGEFVVGARRLVAKVGRVRPRFLAILGIGAYRTAFARPDAVLGLQRETLGSTRIWVLPNPAGSMHTMVPRTSPDSLLSCARLPADVRGLALAPGSPEPGASGRTAAAGVGHPGGLHPDAREKCPLGVQTGGRVLQACGFEGPCAEARLGRAWHLCGGGLDTRSAGTDDFFGRLSIGVDDPYPHCDG